MERSEKLRCEVCHLTLTEEELNGGYCPECYETTGRKNKEFSKVTLNQENFSQYRCEDCGTTIKAEA